MSASYVAISWNKHKRNYDLVLGSVVLLYVVVFAGISAFLFPDITRETLIIRTTSTLAFLLLHFILSIGPLSRLDTRFLPLLYNRRHLGVTMFGIAAIHGLISIMQFHALGNVNPILSVFISNTHYGSLAGFPFQVLGFFALLILMLMAVTSHDFWLHTLSPRVWKSLHLCVYLAYALVVMHVMLGVIQLESHPGFLALVGGGAFVLITLHLAAAFKQHQLDRITILPSDAGYYRVCQVDEIPDNRAKIICLNEQSIAVFRYDNRISAVSNVCKHQHGPLGEGKIIDGCITCPWHGYQYKPHNGRAPEPFKEKLTTYQVMAHDGFVYVNPDGLPEGTAVDPAVAD